MQRNRQPDLGLFEFRGLHPSVALGTASDRYAGWLGQIYDPERYAGRIQRRKHTVGGKAFVEEVLPVESVSEYFQHFEVLELDFTFYRPLLEKDGQTSHNYHVLRRYSEHLQETDRLLLKVPQAVFAQKFYRKGTYVANEDYLNPDLFTRRFYEPAGDLLGDHLSGFVFEQEYQRKQDCPPPSLFAEQLDGFFSAIPKDTRYHMEVRTEALLTPSFFNVLKKHGLGQVLSHWTWLPSLCRQFSLAGGEFTNAGGDCIMRLLTPRGMRYQDAYARAHPFNRTVEGLATASMEEDAAALSWDAVRQGRRMNLIVNNRAGGNAPIIAQKIAEQFLATTPQPAAEG